MPNTATSPIVNTNYLTSIGFNVIINKLPQISYFAKTVQIAGIDTNNPSRGTPFAKLPLPADHASFGAFSIEFIVDEDLRNWEELTAWLVGITFPESHAQWKNLVTDTRRESEVYTDITIQTLTSSKNANVEITYHNCIPNSVSGFSMISSGNDTEVITASAGFDYSHFTINRLTP